MRIQQPRQRQQEQEQQQSRRKRRRSKRQMQVDDRQQVQSTDTLLFLSHPGNPATADTGSASHVGCHVSCCLFCGTLSAALDRPNNMLSSVALSLARRQTCRGTAAADEPLANMVGGA